MSEPMSRRALMQSVAAGATLLMAPAFLAGCAKTGALDVATALPDPGTFTAQQNELLALIDQWAGHFGYYDGVIDLETQGDMSGFATADCTLTAHAPLWGTKEGEEEPILASDVQATLSKALKRTRIARHDMHMALHPNGTSICLYFLVKGKIRPLPLNVLKVPLAFVVNAVSTPEGLRLHDIHEWSAETPGDARKVLVENCGWPQETELVPYMAFGAVS